MRSRRQAKEIFLYYIVNLTTSSIRSYGETHMHIVSECLRSYQVALALKKDSDLTRHFSRIVHRLKEGGFVGVRGCCWRLKIMF